MKKILFVIIAVILICGLIFSGCAKATTPTPTTTQTPKITPTPTPTPTTVTPKYGGTLRLAHAFGPINAGWPGGALFGFGPFKPVFFDSILSDDAQGNIKPSLATQWELAPDMKSLTLTLRQGVKFHDGSDWNAEVAKWNIDLLLNAQNSSYASATSVDILDVYKIRINLSNFSNTIYYALGDSFVVSKAAYEKNGEEWMATHPVGTGPFSFVSFTPNVSIKGVRFDDYWDGKPYLAAIELYQIPDPITMSNSFEAGEMDIIGRDIDKLEYDLQQKGYEVISSYISDYMLIPDSTSPGSPFTDIKVRQALSYAINREELCRTLGYGWWAPVTQYALPGSPNYLNDLPTNPYDPDKARQLLEEAGHPGGFPASIIADSFVSSKDAVTAMQGYLSKVGITADVSMVDAASISSYLAEGWPNALLGLPRCGVGANWNVGLAMFSNIDPTHVGVPKTAEYDALYNESLAAEQYDPELVKKIVKYLYDNVFIIPIYAVSTGFVVQPYVHDTGFFSREHFWNWTPGKTWLSN